MDEVFIYMANLWVEVFGVCLIKKKRKEIVKLVDLFAFLDFRRFQSKAAHCLALRLMRQAGRAQKQSQK